MFQTTNQMNMSISYVFNYSSGWDMEWNGMEWHGLRHILKNLMVELLTIGFKYYLVLVLSFLQGSAWNSQQTISVWTTEWTFKKSYLMMSSQPQHGVSMTSASSLLVDNQCSESIPPYAPTAYLQQQMLPWPWLLPERRNDIWLIPIVKCSQSIPLCCLCSRSIPLTLKQLA